MPADQPLQRHLSSQLVYYFPPYNLLVLPLLPITSLLTPDSFSNYSLLLSSLLLIPSLLTTYSLSF